MLQLAEGTHLTLDETALEAGTLNATGIQNLASLKHLLEWQKVEYDFQFYKMEMPADLPVLILSQVKAISSYLTHLMVSVQEKGWLIHSLDVQSCNRRNLGCSQQMLLSPSCQLQPLLVQLLMNWILQSGACTLQWQETWSIPYSLLF
jgi:hypothetical protein